MSVDVRGLIRILFVLVIANSLSVFADDTTYRLAFHFQPGQFWHYEFDDRAEMLAQFGENQSKTFQQTHVLRSYRVVAVDEKGGATIEPIVEMVRMTSQSGERPAVSFDSATGEAPPKEFEKIAGTIGRPLARFQVGANGRLAKVSMLTTDVPKNLLDAAENTDPAINFLIVLPDKPIKIGEKWNEKFDTFVSVANDRNTQFNTKFGLIRSYELVKVADHVATISVRTSLLTPNSNPEILRQLVQVTPSGTIEFDMTQGRILNRTLKLDEKVIGAFGSQSLLQAQGESVEKLVTPKLANNPSSPSPK